MIFNHLVITNAIPEKGSRATFNLMIGSRKVCSPVFQAHWCISKAQLNRYIRLVREGLKELPHRITGDCDAPALREAVKQNYVITWFLQYASEVTEKLPDCDELLLPRMLWADLHKLFADDMQASGHSSDTCGLSYFKRVFDSAEELAHIRMTTFKRNFSKCATCIELSGEVTNALKGHDPKLLAIAKDKRLAHYILARSDKLHYWRQRWQARSQVATKLTLIIDKMDSAKNYIPWFSNGRKPKDIADLLKYDILKLHVTGVIIHGNPDTRYLFWSLPWMPGNANLNLECLRRALVHHLRGLAFRPKLYIQFDNASDNKCYAVLCLCGWLVYMNFVVQVRHPASSLAHMHPLDCHALAHRTSHV